MERNCIVSEKELRLLKKFLPKEAIQDLYYYGPKYVKVKRRVRINLRRLIHFH